MKLVLLSPMFLVIKMKTLYKCTNCGEYTLKHDVCPYCGGKTYTPHPARFSIEKEQKYSKYRRELIKKQLVDSS